MTEGSRAIIAGGVAGLILLVAGGVAAAKSDFFSRLAELEKREQRHRRAAEWASREVDQWSDSLDDLTPTGDLANRTRDRLRRRIGTQLMRWESVHRNIRRRRLVTPPGDLRDTAVLLRGAERRALRRQSERFEGFRTLSGGRSGGDELVVRRADATVRLARHRAGRRTMARAGARAVERLHRHPESELRAAVDDATEGLERALDEAWNHATEGDFHRRKGALYPPVPGQPASVEEGDGEAGPLAAYAERDGLIFPVDQGTDVVAVGRGRVVVAKRIRGYGRTVVVDHGDDYRSIYAHLQSVEVDLGESVERGASVGRSGASESLAGPLLYFEFRRDDELLAPRPWFVQR